jgi:hypothetical protein
VETPDESTDLAVDPPQPEPVVRALQSLLADPRPAVDPWWQAGNDESLRS